MKTIIQISDLHFGRTNPEIVASLESFVTNLKPDVLVVSGDLTQRAKIPEFLQAQKFLNLFSCTKIIIPGNHDVPLYNIWRRFKNPYQRFSSHINPLLEPFYIDDEVAVIGINTSRSLVFKGGRINSKQIKSVMEKLTGLNPKIIKIVATHHPLKQIRNKKALKALIGAGVNIFLSGHLHQSGHENFEHLHNNQNYSALLVEAGTATSVRYKNEVNAFNVISINNNRVTIDRFSWQAQDHKFTQTHSETYTRGQYGWMV